MMLAVVRGVFVEMHYAKGNLLEVTEKGFFEC